MERKHVEIAAILALFVIAIRGAVKAEEFASIIVVAAIAIPILMGLILVFRR